MRTFFEEGDLLVAEVQMLYTDGAMSLHTRSLKYGKLRNGQLVTVPPVLIRRLKSHFITLPCGVDLILGLNGYIWVSKHVKQAEQEGEEGFDAEAVYSNRNDVSLYIVSYRSPSAQTKVAPDAVGYRRRNTVCYISGDQYHSSAVGAFRSFERYCYCGGV